MNVEQMINEWKPHNLRHSETVEMEQLCEWFKNENNKLGDYEIGQTDQEFLVISNARMCLIEKYEDIKRKIYAFHDKQKKNSTRDNTQKLKRSFLGTVQFAHEIVNVEESKDILINGIKKYLDKNVKNFNFKRTVACIEHGKTGKRPHVHFCFTLTDDTTRLSRLKPAECRNSLLRIFKNHKMDIRIEKGQQNIAPAVKYVLKCEREHLGYDIENLDDFPEKIIFCNTINGKEI